MKYKKGEWVTIVKNNATKFYNRYMGRTVQIVGVSTFYVLPLASLQGKNTEYSTLWDDDEVRLATPKEIEQAQLRLCAEEL